MSKVQIKDAGFFYENLNLPIVITDDAGNEYRITVNGEGIAINKLGGKEGQICIYSESTNKIFVK